MCADPTDSLGGAGAAPDHLVRAAREAEAAGCAASGLASHFDRAIQMVVAQADLPGHTDHLPEPVPALLVAEPATDQFVP